MMKKKKPASAGTATANLHMRVPIEEKRAFMQAAAASKFDFTTWARLLMRKASGMDKR
jgi:hypothetical protein